MNAAETDKTGPEASAQAVRAYEDAKVSECRAGSQKTDVFQADGPNPERPAESRTEPHGATVILRLIAHGRGCECDLCTNQHAKEAAK